MLRCIFNQKRILLESTEWTDFAFVLIAGIIAYHGISYRDVEGECELVHLFIWLNCIILWNLGFRPRYSRCALVLYC